ncbi:hypothetical protein BpHYR1_014554 [Brachionus plicatilis]|uniref:Uncharacterized protein n=1 Tax=Brachionus plicatilis TaxID=10195 RepID=A0A3M7PUG2_BRAPC|nr:hypothetical protein BpHYR1_014554 [Brachionus plicatilis]
MNLAEFLHSDQQHVFLYLVHFVYAGLEVIWDSTKYPPNYIRKYLLEKLSFLFLSSSNGYQRSIAAK